MRVLRRTLVCQGLSVGREKRRQPRQQRGNPDPSINMATVVFAQPSSAVWGLFFAFQVDTHLLAAMATRKGQHNRRNYGDNDDSASTRCTAVRMRNVWTLESL